MLPCFAAPIVRQDRDPPPIGSHPRSSGRRRAGPDGNVAARDVLHLLGRQDCRLGIEVSPACCWKGNNWFDMEITHEKSSHGRLRGHNPSCIVGLAATAAEQPVQASGEVTEEMHEANEAVGSLPTIR